MDIYCMCEEKTIRITHTEQKRATITSTTTDSIDGNASTCHFAQTDSYFWMVDEKNPFYFL